MKINLRVALVSTAAIGIVVGSSTSSLGSSQSRRPVAANVQPTSRNGTRITAPGENAAGIQNEVSSLEAQIESLSKVVDELKTEVLRLQIGQFTNSHDSVIIDPASSKGYQRLDASTGSFFVSLDDVVPFLDGYKVILNVGNPMDVTYDGFNLKVRWGPRYDWSAFSVATYKTWSSQIKEQTFPFADSLRPGAWNKVNVNISPAKAEDLGYLEDSIETNTVRMYQPSQ